MKRFDFFAERTKDRHVVGFKADPNGGLVLHSDVKKFLSEKKAEYHKGGIVDCWQMMCSSCEHFRVSQKHHKCAHPEGGLWCQLHDCPLIEPII